MTPRLQRLGEPIDFGPVRLANRAVLCTTGEAAPDMIIVHDPDEPFAQRSCLRAAFVLVAERLTYM
jgi:hypothetical protein